MRIAEKDSSLFPSDNEWGVPALDLSMQPREVTAPIVAWGSVSRAKMAHGGTTHFYVDDYRFSTDYLADQVISTKPVAVVEPNFTCLDWHPRARILATVYEKRRLAAKWQAAGIRTWVDLCMPHAHMDLALLGVPDGWTHFATRGWEARPDDVRVEYCVARSKAYINTVTFLVIGGGKRVAEVVRLMPGAIHYPDHMGARRARV